MTFLDLALHAFSWCSSITLREHIFWKYSSYKTCVSRNMWFLDLMLRATNPRTSKFRVVSIAKCFLLLLEVSYLSLIRWRRCVAHHHGRSSIESGASSQVEWLLALLVCFASSKADQVVSKRYVSSVAWKFVRVVSLHLRYKYSQIKII